jgi:3-hydroxyisobutyrate dehydrogenase
MKMKIGFIGLGRMGFPMANSLIRAGYSLVVHNRSKTPVERLALLGAQAASSPSEVALSSDVVISSVLTPEQVEEIYLGTDGVINTAHKGQVFIDTSSISPKTSKKIGEAIKKRGATFIDAPVSGGPKGAKNGTLTLMVGADSASLEKVRKILEVFGKNIFHMGPIGAGSSTKICNQILTGTAHIVVAEAMVLGTKLGLDPQMLFEVLHLSSGQCQALDRSVPEAILPRNFDAVFTIDGMIKDLECAIQTARENNVRLVLPALTQQIYQEAKSLGHSNQHLASVIIPMEKIAGVVVSKINLNKQ